MAAARADIGNWFGRSLDLYVPQLIFCQIYSIMIKMRFLVCLEIIGERLQYENSLFVTIFKASAALLGYAELEPEEAKALQAIADKIAL